MASYQTDPHYPCYHLRAREEAVNDPCGAIWWGDEYHLFYQWNARWVHAASSDLVHWRHFPIALMPTPGSCDEGGCWSGAVGEVDGKPVILYTGVDFPPPDQPREWRQVVCMATGSDDLVNWTKFSGNPVIGAPPPDLRVTGFRDPCFWKDGDTWYMLIGGGITGQGATAFLYRSADFRSWEYVHPFGSDSPDVTNNYWECPDFFALGDRHVLLTSKMSPQLWNGSTDSCRTLMSTFYSVGTYRNQQFDVESRGNTDAGGHFYAAKTLLDGKGRRLLWGWIWEARRTEVWREAGWSGVISLPRVLTLGHNGALRYDPPEELQALRDEHWEFEDITLQEADPRPLDALAGDCLELVAEFNPAGADQCGLTLRRSKDGSEQTRLVWRASEATLTVDRTQSSLDPEPFKFPRSGRVELAAGENLRLHVFLDRSVLEVFANGQLCLSSRIYPTREDSLGVAVFAKGGRALLQRLDAWSLVKALPTGDPGDT